MRPALTRCGLLLCLMFLSMCMISVQSIQHCSLFGLICHDESHDQVPPVERSAAEHQGQFEPGLHEIDDVDLQAVLSFDEKVSGAHHASDDNKSQNGADGSSDATPGVEPIFLVIKFHATWCPFSRKLNPVYDALARSFPTHRFFSIDGSKYSSLNRGMAVNGFPTVIIAKNGLPVAHYKGTNSLTSIKDWVTKVTEIEPTVDAQVELEITGRSTKSFDVYMWAAVSMILFCTTRWLVLLTRPLLAPPGHDKDD